MREQEFNLDKACSFETAAKRIGASRSFVVRLARQGLIDTVESETREVQLPGRSVIRLGRMRRLHRDFGVNFAGAAVILDLVSRIESLNRDLTELQRSTASKKPENGHGTYNH